MTHEDPYNEKSGPSFAGINGYKDVGWRKSAWNGKCVPRRGVT